MSVVLRLEGIVIGSSAGSSAGGKTERVHVVTNHGVVRVRQRNVEGGQVDHVEGDHVIQGYRTLGGVLVFYLRQRQDDLTVAVRIVGAHHDLLVDAHTVEVQRLVRPAVDVVGHGGEERAGDGEAVVFAVGADIKAVLVEAEGSRRGLAALQGDGHLHGVAAALAGVAGRVAVVVGLDADGKGLVLTYRAGDGGQHRIVEGSVEVRSTQPGAGKRRQAEDVVRTGDAVVEQHFGPVGLAVDELFRIKDLQVHLLPEFEGIGTPGVAVDGQFQGWFVAAVDVDDHRLGVVTASTVVRTGLDHEAHAAQNGKIITGHLEGHHRPGHAVGRIGKVLSSDAGALRHAVQKELTGEAIKISPGDRGVVRRSVRPGIGRVPTVQGDDGNAVTAVVLTESRRSAGVKTVKTEILRPHRKRKRKE